MYRYRVYPGKVGTHLPRAESLAVAEFEGDSGGFTAIEFARLLTQAKGVNGAVVVVEQSSTLVDVGGTFQHVEED